MSTSSVARLLGLTANGVRELDDELRPARVDGRRVYLREVVERVAAERDHRRDLRSGRIR